MCCWWICQGLISPQPAVPDRDLPNCLTPGHGNSVSELVALHSGTGLSGGAFPTHDLRPGAHECGETRVRDLDGTIPSMAPSSCESFERFCARLFGKTIPAGEAVKVYLDHLQKSWLINEAIRAQAVMESNEIVVQRVQRVRARRKDDGQGFEGSRTY